MQPQVVVIASVGLYVISKLDSRSKASQTSNILRNGKKVMCLHTRTIQLLCGMSDGGGDFFDGMEGGVKGWSCFVWAEQSYRSHRRRKSQTSSTSPRPWIRVVPRELGSLTNSYTPHGGRYRRPGRIESSPSACSYHSRLHGGAHHRSPGWGSA